MTNYAEVVFENIREINVLTLLNFLINDSSEAIITAQCSEDIGIIEKSVLSEQNLSLFTQYNAHNTAICLSIRLKKFIFDNIIIPSISLRCLKYDALYDVDFIFEESYIDKIGSKEFLSKLQNYTTQLAIKYEIDNWYCGLEPAKDLNTRYFTKDEPISIHKG